MLEVSDIIIGFGYFIVILPIAITLVIAGKINREQGRIYNLYKRYPRIIWSSMSLILMIVPLVVAVIMYIDGERELIFPFIAIMLIPLMCNMIRTAWSYGPLSVKKKESDTPNTD
ncbi:MAG: hypothetical protein ACW98Y_09855 [Candidatus Thorarchaeota archaeon]